LHKIANNANCFVILFLAFQEAQNGGASLRHEQTLLDAAIRELEKSRNRMKKNLLQASHDVTRRLERASILASSGGSPGMYEFARTGQLLPILIGTTMTDPAGSGRDVPILSAEQEKMTGRIRPLGGTMEDPEGQGKSLFS
jgi:hypothetical protein